MCCSSVCFGVYSANCRGARESNSNVDEIRKLVDLNMVTILSGTLSAEQLAEGLARDYLTGKICWG